MNKLMIIGIVTMIVTGAAMSARCAVMCSGESALVTLDFTTGVRIAATSEIICYSSGWVGGAAADATAVVAVNGETLFSAVGSGYVDWPPMSNGTYTLTHKVMSGGEQVGETLTAIFLV